MASYEGATLTITELFSKAILLTMFVYGDCMAMEIVAEIAKSTNLYVCVYTLPFKSLGSLRNVLVFERKSHSVHLK